MRFRRFVAACDLLVVIGSNAFAQEPRREPASKDSEPPAPASAKRLEPGPVPEDGIPVLVIDAESGEPVANALVTWFEERENFFARALPEPQLEAERIEHGRTVATDAKGETKIARSSLIVASADGRYAARRWSRAIESPMKFALKRARRLDIAVVDEEKRPVEGAPLSLAGRSGPAGSVDSWRLATDADGRASFAPLDLFLGFDSRAPHDLFVRVDAPLGEPFEKKLDERQLPAEPVTFTLPPTGTLALEVADEKGEPLSGEHYVTIDTLPAGSPDAAFDEAKKSGSEDEWFCFDARSRYELRCVALHRRMRIEFSDGDLNSRTLTLEGPTERGERVNTKLVVAPAEHMEITASVVGPGDRPLADTAITLRLIAPGQVPTDLPESARFEPDDVRIPLEARTDSKGGVTWSLQKGWSCPDLEEFERRIDRVEVEQTEKRGVVAIARRAFAPAKEGHRHDLGTVKLVPTPRFVSGRVVDDAGQPIAGAKVVVTGTKRPKEGGPTYIGSCGTPRYDQEFAGESAADGSFVLFALPVPDADFEAQAALPEDAANSVAEPEYERSGGRRVAVRAGDHDVELTLSRVGTIAGKIEGDADEVARLGYHLELRPTVSASSGQSGGIEGAEFSLEGIPVGFATLQLRDKGGHAVARVADIAVRAGEVTRLPPIVLAEARHVLVLAIRDEAGRPVAKGWVARPAPADQPDPFDLARNFFKTMAPEGTGIDFDDLPFDEIRAPSITPFQEGALTLRGNERFHALAVGAPGCCSVMLHDVEGEQAVTLRPAPKVALVLELDGDPPRDGNLVATLAPPSDDDEWYRFGPGAFPGPGADFDESERAAPVVLAPGREIAVPVRATGAARVRLSLAQQKGTGGLGMPLRCEPRTITITESRDLQVFHVRVSAESLKAATPPSGERR